VIPRRYPGETAIVVGTGPSLTPELLQRCNDLRREGAVRIFGANRAWEVVECDVVHGCNHQFWDLWWPKGLGEYPAEKWTTRLELRGKYAGLNYIEERWADGLSTDPSYIHAHHGTGPQLVNIAYLYGCSKLILIGWDMTFGPKRDPSDQRRTYIGKRRYLGEDPLTADHWPMTGPEGQLEGLIREMETIHPEDYGIQIINATAGSAMRCFPMMSFDDALATP